MRIIIDIDDKVWMDEKSIREVAFEYEKGCAFDRAIREGLKQAIVLPKNHGRLIEAEKLKDSITTITRNVLVNSVESALGMALYKISNAPTIIEAEGDDDE